MMYLWFTLRLIVFNHKYMFYVTLVFKNKKSEKKVRNRKVNYKITIIL